MQCCCTQPREPDKEWPVEHWIALGQSLRARNLRLVLPWGNAREQERSRAIAAALPDAEVPDLQPLDAVARLIAGAALVVGVDTGLLHLAGALGVPLVGIFVGSEPGLDRSDWGRGRSRWLAARASCRMRSPQSLRSIASLRDGCRLVARQAPR